MEFGWAAGLEEPEEEELREPVGGIVSRLFGYRDSKGEWREGMGRYEPEPLDEPPDDPPLRPPPPLRFSRVCGIEGACASRNSALRTERLLISEGMERAVVRVVALSAAVR